MSPVGEADPSGSVWTGRWTGDPRVAAPSHSPSGADAPFRFTAREGSPLLPLNPQWPRTKSNGCRQYRNASLSRHWKNRPGCRAVSRIAALVTTPLRLSSDEGSFGLRKRPARPRRPVMSLASNVYTVPSVRCHLPTGVPRCRCPAPPLAARVAGSLRRGGQALWTLWTAVGGWHRRPERAPSMGTALRPQPQPARQTLRGHSIATRPTFC